MVAEWVEDSSDLYVGTGLSAVITWIGLGWCTAEPHAL